MPWARYRYRKNKVWIRIDEAEQPVLDDRGLAALRYKVDDDRTYTVRPDELRALEVPEPIAPDPPPPTGEPGPRERSDAEESDAKRGDTDHRGGEDPDAIRIYTDGASSGNPGPSGIGAVLLWHGKRREISRYLGDATNNIAELTAVLDALRAVKRPRLPVRLHTDSTYVLGVLTQGHKVKANAELVAELRAQMARFADLQFIKVPAHAGVPENERADRLAVEAVRNKSP